MALGFIVPLLVSVIPVEIVIDVLAPRVILPVVIIVVAPVIDSPPVFENVPVPVIVFVAPLMVSALVVPVIEPLLKTRLPDKATDCVLAANVPPTVNVPLTVRVPEGVSVLPLTTLIAAGLIAAHVCEAPPLK